MNKRPDETPTVRTLVGDLGLGALLLHGLGRVRRRLLLCTIVGNHHTVCMYVCSMNGKAMYPWWQGGMHAW